MNTSTRVDVLIIGAGLSGIAAARTLKTRCPHKSYLILEARGAMGGTWDLFRYPGVRSDSDMYTLGYSFRPWTEGRAIAEGGKILDYVRASARESGIEDRIRFGQRARVARWSSDAATWTVEVEDARGVTEHWVCHFLFACTGYFDYAQGYAPEFAGSETFQGRLFHPQHWPEGLDYAGKRVVVIGSGATAATLVPELAKTAACVTMLQRSPTYMFAAPSADALNDWLRRVLPARLAYRLIRWRNILFGIVFYAWCKRSPARVKSWLLKQAARQLAPGYDIGTHFTPRYDPWDQRICLLPDGDLFHAIREGKAAVVTDHIERIDATGIVLRSGARLDADIIVSATGLNLVALGGMQLSVDGREVDLAATLSYRGCMYSDVPNLASALGYTNASWTLKLELCCEYVCRLLRFMQRRGLQVCVPRNDDPGLRREPWLNLSSGYIQRVAHTLPKQGSKMPWRLRQNYALDLINLRFGAIDDGVMRFSSATGPAGIAPQSG